MKISKTQVLNLIAMAGGIAASIYAYTAPGGAVHLPASLAWVPGVAAAIAGLSRSILPGLSGVPGQQPGVIPTQPTPKGA